jgi:alkyl sulfatase BDS1-like metallo-beta-lactamase superfamily hydrolase
MAALTAERTRIEPLWLLKNPVFVHTHTRTKRDHILMAVTVQTPSAGSEFAGREALKAHSSEFRKAVHEVAQGIYVAVGYSASNVTLIQGKSGAIIVDTSANPNDAAAIIAAFGDRMLRPVQAIIYTHNHPDHSGGATVFAGADSPPIWSHRLVVTGEAEFGRGTRDGGDAFGTALPAEDFINAGTQLEYGRETAHTREGFLPPTFTYEDAAVLTIDGIELHLLHTPGESPENTAVWLPAAKVLLAGDDFLKTFPNLSPIRGLPLRPPKTWVESLEKMITLEPDHVIPGHMHPISGAKDVRDALTCYRDAIRHVLDATVKGIKQGITPDELVGQVKLPDHLAKSPYLQEFYGSVAWSVRGIYAAYVGWFDGNPTNMFPLSPEQRARRIIDLAGGASVLLDQAAAALKAGDFQWAAELSDHLIAADIHRAEARRIKAEALFELGDRQINATARNYYLTVAKFLGERS